MTESTQHRVRQYKLDNDKFSLLLFKLLSNNNCDKAQKKIYNYTAQHVRMISYIQVYVT